MDKCIININKTDILEGDARYNCEICGKLVDQAKKSTGIYTLPNILLFCLQRYKSGTKNSDAVQYPIKGLDMSKHLRNDNHKYKDEDMLYDLYAIVNHLGNTLNSGHYIADCYNEENDSWYNFNDSTVTKITCVDDEAL